MDRREVFKAFAALGAGIVVGEQTAHADHDKPASGPLHAPHVHFCGIHIAKNNPKFQLTVQHYFAAHTTDEHGDPMFQCVLFDSMGKNAKLLGVEYVITDNAYRSLPDAEKKFWHAHTYEVLGGGLIAPGMEDAEEKKFMKMLLTTWGKTWHTWPDPSTSTPLGEPLLIWSLTADGQIDEKVLAERDKEFKVSTAKIREQRCKELGLEVPNVPLPDSLETRGRQWTKDGDDKPTRRK